MRFLETLALVQTLKGSRCSSAALASPRKMDGLFPRLDAPSRTPSPSSQLSLVVHVHDLKHMSTQDHVVYLPRSTGLRTTFAEIKTVVAVKARVEEDRVADGKVDGMTVSMK